MNKSYLLQELASKYETKEFLKGDPSWFMHQVKGDSNQELFAFIASSLSYGKRNLFFPKIQKIFDFAEGDVFNWVKSGEFRRDIPNNDNCYYRLYTNNTLYSFLESLKELIDQYSTLSNFVHQESIDGYSAIIAITRYFSNHGIESIIPKNASSACKRVCMFLRWMVRDNSPVDLGLWPFIDKRTLIIPLDTHVLEEACNLNLLQSRTTSMSVARKLTAKLANTFPDDPTKGDFALFGYGINK
jgi:uncharacterized protein (TIGR02757 family)